MAGRLRIFADAPDAEFVRAANPGGLSAALAAYFAGDLAAIEKLPIAESDRHAVPALGLARAARDPVRREPIVR